MQNFRDRVAVVTGAASGIGRALAERCAQEGMKVVLADVDEAGLDRLAQALKAQGAHALPLRTDVSNPGDVEQLAQRTLDEFGGVHLVFNNAGVGGGGFVWESTLADWQWVLGVNLWGVIHGVRTFVPIMLRQGAEGHIVNTASIAGLMSGPGLGIYKVTKHAVVSLSETLSCELDAVHAPIRVSVLCPAWVRTNIAESERNRPPELRNRSAATTSPIQAAMEQQVREAVAGGSSPEEIADAVFEAIREKRFYILPHEEMARALVQARMSAILEGGHTPACAPAG